MVNYFNGIFSSSHHGSLDIELGGIKGKVTSDINDILEQESLAEEI